ncbi:L-seryl-tRNA(Sec) selenium transferase [Synergistaceae bacterium OttesenSCG-928-D05]|nr:L-seryl-tRNA(Sec) selenium transferase [Synergistaceae bacterium OttesenSCG-928-D05]
MQQDIGKVMRKIPSMDKLLALPQVRAYEAELGHDTVKSILTGVLDAQRKKILSNPDTAFDSDSIARDAEKMLKRRAFTTLRRVVNATGVVNHTNLGRSLLANEAAEAVSQIASNYNTLEYSIETGSRGHRNDHVEWLLCRLTGAEAALVVNNNAGAVILALAALAKDRETVVSRGELVEIGGSFRIPEIMGLSGTKMVEVGTTNRTHLRDYEQAVTEDTALLLKVHPSNYRINGFTASVPREELAALAHGKNLVFMEDLGSGMLIDMSEAGLREDPTVRQCLEAGVDVVTFSGDKLLGGPQIGAIVGSARIIDALRSYPLLRALRVDKMTLAAFEATLRLYLKGKTESIPTLAMIFAKKDELQKQARRFSKKIKDFFEQTNLRSVRIEVVPVKDAVGGGAFPQTELSGYAVSLYAPEFGSAGKLAEKFRNASVPVITGAAEDRVLFHMRTISAEDEELIVSALREMLVHPAAQER